MKRRLRPAHAIVLDALAEGLEVRIGAHQWVLLPDEHDSPRVVVKFWNETRKEPHYVDPGLTLNAFLRHCRVMDERDLMTLAANTALNQITKKDRSPNDPGRAETETL